MKTIGKKKKKKKKGYVHYFSHLQKGFQNIISIKTLNCLAQ